MSADARKWTLAALVAAIVGLALWWTLRPDADHAAPAKPVVAATKTPDADPAPAAKRRDRTDADAPSADEAAAADEQQPPKPAPLTVRVLSAVDDAPIAGATVRVEDYDKDEKRERTATTDATGAAVVMTFALCDGPDVSASADGYVRTGRQRRPFGAKPGDDVVVIRLMPATTLEGVVLDAKTGAPLAGAKVVADHGGEDVCGFGVPDGPYAEVVTGADGKFRLAGVPTAGPTSVEAEAEGRVSDSVEWDGDVSRRIEFRLEPTPPGVIRGVVRDAAGAPVKGALVRARRPDSPRSDDTKTADDGAYEIAGLRLGHDYDVWAHNDDARTFLGSAVANVALATDTPSAVCDLVLVPSAELTLHVRDESGKPIEDACVDVGRVGMRWHPKLDATGDATLELAGSGAFAVEITAEGFVAHQEGFEVAGGAKRTLSVVLARGAEISGVVVDDTGAPVADARVWAEPANFRGYTVRASAGADGVFHMTGCLAETTYRVTATDDDDASVLTSAPKDGLRLTMTRRGVVTFATKAPPDTTIRFAFATTDGKRSFSEARIFDGDAIEPLDVPAGTYDVVASVSGFAPTRRRVVVKPGETVDLGEIVFDRGVALAGRVLDKDARPIAGARVTANVGGDAADHVAWTDATGAFRVFRLPVGELTLAVAAEGFVGDVVSVKATKDSAPVVATLRRGGGLKGRVVDPPRKHVKDDLIVRAFHQTEGGDGDLVEFPVKPDGAFAIRLAPGAWKLDVHAGTNVAFGTKDVLVREGEETSVEIVLER